MTQSMLEHVNFTVADATKTAQKMIQLFDWKIRWEGPAIDRGYTVHVGGEDSYLALYMPPEPKAREGSKLRSIGNLNHVGVVVHDLDRVEKSVRQMGYEPHSFADYEPGRRFYFLDENGIEFEVVSYAPSEPDGTPK